MKTKTNIKAGGYPVIRNHNETIVRAGLKTKTRLKAGSGLVRNHNETLVTGV